MKKKILIATNNLNKINEFKEMLDLNKYEVYSLKDLNIDIDVEETGNSYEENAFLKAKAFSYLKDYIVIADDSGLEIDALGEHFPGIKTHRYAESLGWFPDALYKILELMKDKNNRSAHYTCAICAMNIAADPQYFYGFCYGKIDTEIKGNNGFGFDPIFISDELNINLGLASDEEKNAISHRGKALKEFIKYLEENNI